jgi:hypothetical protein
MSILPCWLVDLQCLANRCEAAASASALILPFQLEDGEFLGSRQEGKQGKM